MRYQVAVWGQRVKMTMFSYHFLNFQLLKKLKNLISNQARKSLLHTDSIAITLVTMLETTNKIDFKKSKRRNQAHNLSSKKYDYVENSASEKHKRSKSQTINSFKYRKGNSYQENKPINRSRGKRDKIVSFPSQTVSKIMSTVSKAKKMQQHPNAAMLKKIAFKSFDKRRAGSNLDRREGSFDDPLSFLRSSSAWHKYNQEKVSNGKKSHRTSKTNKHKKSDNHIKQHIIAKYK